MQGMRKSGALASLEDEGGASLTTAQPASGKEELRVDRVGRREVPEKWEGDDVVNRSSTGAAAAAAAMAATLQNIR